MIDFKQLASRVYRSHFVRNVAVMMTGAALARVVSVVFVPVLARIFSPEIYGGFGVYLAVLSIISCVSTLRYDLAMMLPKEHSDAVGVLGVCAIVLLAVSTIAGVVFVPFSGPIAALLKTPMIAPWLWLLPFSIFFMGTWQTLTAWSARRKQFHRISISQVTQSLATSCSQTAVGLATANVFGLIIGRAIGDFCGTAVFLWQIFKHDWALIKSSLSVSRLKTMALEYRTFPLYTAPQSLLNSTSQNVPLILLAYYFGATVAGYYVIGVRIVQMPLRTIKGSLNTVFYQKASEVYNSGGDTYKLFKKTTLGLLAMVILPSLAIAGIAPQLATFVLGADWQMAGKYAQWLILWSAVGFCNIPAVLFGQIYRRQRMLFCLEVVLLLSRVSALVVGGLFCTPLNTVILYSIVGVAYNGFLILWAWNFMSLKSNVTCKNL